MKYPNKIVFVCGANYGGAERITFQIAKFLLDEGFNCHALIAQSPLGENSVESYVPKGLNYSTCQSRFRNRIFHIYKYLKRVCPDAVFCSSPDLSAMILLLKKFGFYKGKIIVRDNNMPSKQDKWIARSSSLLYKYADVLIAQTDEMKNEMVSFYHVDNQKTIVINNPTDTETIQKNIKEVFPFNRDYVNYVSVGRIDLQKDYITTIMAMQLVVKKQPNSRLYIVGGRNNEEYAVQVEELTRELGLQNHVFFEGFQKNPYKYQHGCNVFVLSSIYEGLPNVMLDAMYLGKPVVVTESIPYISKVVHNGINGYTVPVGDYIALAEALIKAPYLCDLPQFVPVNDSKDKFIRAFKQLIRE